MIGTDVGEVGQPSFRTYLDIYIVNGEVGERVLLKMNLNVGKPCRIALPRSNSWKLAFRRLTQ
jgi:hypothetical protein